MNDSTLFHRFEIIENCLYKVIVRYNRWHSPKINLVNSTLLHVIVFLHHDQNVSNHVLMFLSHNTECYRC